MKFKFILLLLFSFYFSFAGNHFIHRSNNILLDSNEKEIKLRGVNLGGWLLWEEWIWGGKFHSQTHIMDALTQMTSKEDAEKFRDSIYMNYITEADIKKIAAAHFNVVRVPLNYRIFVSDEEPDPFHNIGWKILDSLFARCRRHSVYAILDMHGAPGGQSNFFIADPEKEKLWKSDEQKKHLIVLWEAIAQRYGNDPALAGYDLLNEPIPDKKRNLVRIYDLIIAAIRKADKNHMIVIEGANFAKDFSMFDKLLDDNMMFEFHFYNWFGGKPEKKLIYVNDLSKKLNVPMWCGEWGENKYDALKETKNYFEGANISGWCFWTWKKVKNGYPALNEIRASDNWEILIAAVKNKKKRKNITKEYALDAMKDFLVTVRSSSDLSDETLLGILKAF